MKKAIFNASVVLAAAKAGELSSAELKKAIARVEVLGLRVVMQELHAVQLAQQMKTSVIATFDDGAPREVVESFYEAIATVEHVLKHRLQRTRNMVKRHGVLGT